MTIQPIPIQLVQSSLGTGLTNFTILPVSAWADLANFPIS